METLTRRRFSFVAVAGAVAALAALPRKALAAPNGTRPTKLVNLAVVSASSTQMRVTGRLLTMDNRGISGMRVDIYSVGVASFSRRSTVYTGNDGSFTATCSKASTGQQVQVEVEGNGAYSRPFPTFARV